MTAHNGCVWAGRGVWRCAGALVTALLLATVSGCDYVPSVDDVCARFQDHDCPTWSGEDACKTDGKAVYDRVEQAGGCDGALDEYLICLHDSSSCDWSTICPAERSAVEGCIGAF